MTYPQRFCCDVWLASRCIWRGDGKHLPAAGTPTHPLAFGPRFRQSRQLTFHAVMVLENRGKSSFLFLWYGGSVFGNRGCAPENERRDGTEGETTAPFHITRIGRLEVSMIVRTGEWCVRIVGKLRASWERRHESWYGYAAAGRSRSLEVRSQILSYAPNRLTPPNQELPSWPYQPEPVSYPCRRKVATAWPPATLCHLPAL